MKISRALLVCALGLARERSEEANWNEQEFELATHISEPAASTETRMVKNMEDLAKVFDLDLEMPSPYEKSKKGKLLRAGTNVTEKSESALLFEGLLREKRERKLRAKGVLTDSVDERQYTTLLGIPCDKNEQKRNCFAPPDKQQWKTSFAEWKSSRAQKRQNEAERRKQQSAE